MRQPDDQAYVGELNLFPLYLGATESRGSLLPGNANVKWNENRKHGDMVKLSVSGYIMVLGRAKDIMNIDGMMTSPVEIERICDLDDESILDTAAIGVPPVGVGPETLVLFVVLKKGFTSQPDKLKMIFSKTLQRNLNSCLEVSLVRIVLEFPRTDASNKLPRRVLRDQVKHELSVQSNNL